ncbi:MAG: alpha-galactosidase [Armatimonadota bacterium]|nr:alpha-galactosidase [Armatimonadota bacterium]
MIIRRRPSTLIWMLLAVLALSVSTVFAADNPKDAAMQLLNDITSGKAIFFDLEPEFGTVRNYTVPTPNGKINTVLESSGGYVVKMTGIRSEKTLRLKFSLKRKDGKEFKTISYGVAADTNGIPGFKQVEFYHDGRERTSGNRNAPVICITNKEECAEIVLGFANQIDTAEVRYDGGTMKMARPAEWESITGKEIKDGVYMDVSNQYWFDAMKSYAKFADEYRQFKPRPIPAQAYEPVWCSWYTLTTGVNESNIWENAKIAKSLGFGTILIDAGWDTPGKVCMDEKSAYGDRIAYRGKFPDMAGLVDRIHKELGMAVEFWASPWSIGQKSAADKEIEDVREALGNPPRSIFFLCPRCEKSGDFLAKNIAGVFKYYHVDGMWWDFLDSVPIIKCMANHKHDYDTHGRGYTAAMTKIMKAIHEINPNALIEVRLNHSNINNKLFANVLETNDTPLYYQDNRDMLVYVRTFVDGCVPKTDPTMWQRSSEEGTKAIADEVAGRFMATMITAGVPSVSQDFTKMPESNKKVVKAYLDFYHAHKMDMMKAEFRPLRGERDCPVYALYGKKATYLYTDIPKMPKFEMKREPKVIYLFSACQEPKVSVEITGLLPGKYIWTAYNPFLQPISVDRVEVTQEGLKWDAPVPVGGMIELRRASDF